MKGVLIRRQLTLPGHCVLRQIPQLRQAGSPICCSIGIGGLGGRPGTLSGPLRSVRTGGGWSRRLKKAWREYGRLTPANP